MPFVTGIAPKFADDTKIAKVVNDLQTEQEMQSIINELELWCEKWGMQFNVKKCCIMHFGHNNRKAKYTMNGQTQATAPTQRDLGIIISDKDCLVNKVHKRPKRPTKY